MPDSILRTKLHRPATAGDFVCRPRLHARLDEGLAGPLTLVAAPAGYGKTTLVSHWLDGRPERSAWLSLDEDDADTRTFLRHVVAGVQLACPAACPETYALLAAPSPPSHAAVVRSLVNELDAIEDRLVLVLDDYHALRDAEAHDVINALLQHPPQRLNLLICTRRDPPLRLAVLRAQNRLTEVRMADLAFTRSETEAFLARAVGRTVDNRAIANLQEQLEGWAVGLRLAALAARYQERPEAFLAQLRGGTRDVQHYLTEEVVSHQSAYVQDWLRKTSILGRFCAPLCEAICKGDEVSTLDGESFVRTIEDGGLFALSLDPARRWYRFHALFREVLQQQLRQRVDPEYIAELHTRASAWFAESGLTDEAIYHALEAGEINGAADVVERNRQAAIEFDRWHDLETWLSRLPETIVRQRPEILISRAWVNCGYSRFEAIPPILDQVEAVLADGPDEEALRAEIAYFRGIMLPLQGDGAGALKYWEEFLVRYPATFSGLRAHVEFNLATARQMQGHKDQALRRLNDLVARADLWSELGVIRLLGTCVLIHLVSGDLAEAEAASRRFQRAAEGGRYPFATVWSTHLQGLIKLYRCDLDAAVEHLGRSVSQRFIHFKRAAADSMTGLMLAYQAQGREDDSQATFRSFQDYAASLDKPAVWPLVRSAEARLAVMKGQVEPARRWLEETALEAAGPMMWWLEIPSVTRCRVLIADGPAVHLEEAEARLHEYAAMNEAHHNTCQLITNLTLLAVACDKQGKQKEALQFLERAVRMARPGGFIFPFLELGPSMVSLLRRLGREIDGPGFVRDLIAACEPSVPTPPAVGTSDAGMLTVRALPPELVGRLTLREQEVLELLAQRLPTKEIAARLFVAPSTASSHVKSIYRKLDVRSRREAIARLTASGMRPRP